MLDTPTLLFMITMLNLLLALTLYFYWRTQKTYDGFGYWSIANGLIALAYFLYSFQGMVPNLLSIWLADALSIFALAIRNEGIRRFWAKGKVQKKEIALISLWLLLLLLFSTGEHFSAARIVFVAIGQTYFLGKIAWNMPKEGSNLHQTTTDTLAALHLSFSVLLLLRAAERLLYIDTQDLLAATFMNTVYYALGCLIDVGVAGLFLMLNSQRLEEELRQSQKEMESLATADSLTGIYNRRKLFELGEKEITRSRRLGKGFSLLLFDIDYFKSVNDTYGHSAGDQTLLRVVRIVQENIRDIDVFGRVGGDEFVIIFPETGVQETYIVAERLRKAVDEYWTQWEKEKIPVKLSIGLVELAEQDTQFIDLLKRADINLYRAKHDGRNQVAWE